MELPIEEENPASPQGLTHASPARRVQACAMSGADDRGEVVMRGQAVSRPVEEDDPRVQLQALQATN